MLNEESSSSKSAPAHQTFLAIRPMSLDDLPAIMALEVRCFDSPWSADIYRRELAQSSFGFYHVIRPTSQDKTLPLPPILAYGGCWVMGDESHLMTIATHPEWRQRHLSEWLLLDLLAESRQRAAARCTLEVRSGNQAAIALYEKLGFERVGVRRGYYPATIDTEQEDALIMSLFGLDTGAVWRQLDHRLSTLPTTVEARLLAD